MESANGHKFPWIPELPPSFHKGKQKNNDQSIIDSPILQPIWVDFDSGYFKQCLKFEFCG